MPQPFPFQLYKLRRKTPCSEVLKFQSLEVWTLSLRLLCLPDFLICFILPFVHLAPSTSFRNILLEFLSLKQSFPLLCQHSHRIAFYASFFTGYMRKWSDTPPNTQLTFPPINRFVPDVFVGSRTLCLRDFALFRAFNGLAKGLTHITCIFSHCAI